MDITYLFFIAIATLLVTALLRMISLRHNIIDQPNQRSSHIVPTPRGGGVAIVLVCSVSIIVFFGQQLLMSPFLVAFFVATLTVAVIGLLDDVFNLKAMSRLIIHILAAVWVIFWLRKTLPNSSSGSILEIVGVATPFVLVVFLVWMLNLYNFMDGIDGIAGIQLLTLGGSLLFLISQGFSQSSEQLKVLTIVIATLTASSCGFLCLNFPRAKIFMGDAGSGYIGLAIGVITVFLAVIDMSWLWVVAILYAVFIVDSGLTLLRRVLCGESVLQAHRSHAYQHAAQKYQSHIWVSLGVLAINVLYLLPIAFCFLSQRCSLWLALMLAYLPLGAIAIYYKAGEPYLDERTR